MAAQLYRILRVLEYTGTREQIDRAIEMRQVKGTSPTNWNKGELVIREAIIGETAELLLPADEVQSG